MKVSFEGKIALITGAGAGIGKSIAEAFQSLGATLVIAEIDGRKCEELRGWLKDEGTASLVVQADVCKVDQVDSLRKAIEDRFGHLDILVNNVGHHLGIWNKLVDSKEDEWQALYDINLRHMFVVSRAMIPLMQKSGAGGSIINLLRTEARRHRIHPWSRARTRARQDPCQSDRPGNDRLGTSAHRSVHHRQKSPESQLDIAAESIRATRGQRLGGDISGER
jgi:NAD(P)-dependent dehydrogenase (short-subunit alcohol dehydrogenase family)